MDAIRTLIGPIKRDAAGDVAVTYAAAEKEYEKRGLNAGSGSSLKKLRKVMRIAAGLRPARVVGRRVLWNQRWLHPGYGLVEGGRTQWLHPTKGWRNV